MSNKKNDPDRMNRFFVTRASKVTQNKVQEGSLRRSNVTGPCSPTKEGRRKGLRSNENTSVISLEPQSL